MNKFYERVKEIVTSVPLDVLYGAKGLDFYSQPVKLKLKRSKEGGVADIAIGSWFGVVLSFMVNGTLFG